MFASLIKLLLRGRYTRLLLRFKEVVNHVLLVAIGTICSLFSLRLLGFLFVCSVTTKNGRALSNIGLTSLLLQLRFITKVSRAIVRCLGLSQLILFIFLNDRIIIPDYVPLGRLCRFANYLMLNLISHVFLNLHLVLDEGNAEDLDQDGEVA